MDFPTSSSAAQPQSDFGLASVPRPGRGVETEIGSVLDISGSSSRVLLDAAAIESLAEELEDIVGEEVFVEEE